MKLKFYHTSGTRFKVGDIIGGPGKVVFLHTNPVPHGTIQEIVEAGYGSWEEYEKAHLKDLDEYWKLRDEWNKTQEGEKPEMPKTKNPKPVDLLVYEMKSYNPPVFGSCNDEYLAINDFVEIIRIVGSAKGILNNFNKKFGKKTSKAFHFGGKARAPKGKKKIYHNLNVS